MASMIGVPPAALGEPAGPAPAPTVVPWTRTGTMWIEERAKHPTEDGTPKLAQSLGRCNQRLEEALNEIPIGGVAGALVCDPSPVMHRATKRSTKRARALNMTTYIERELIGVPLVPPSTGNKAHKEAYAAALLHLKALIGGVNHTTALDAFLAYAAGEDAAHFGTVVDPESDEFRLVSAGLTFERLVRLSPVIPIQRFVTEISINKLTGTGASIARVYHGTPHAEAIAAYGVDPLRSLLAEPNRREGGVGLYTSLYAHTAAPHGAQLGDPVDCDVDGIPMTRVLRGLVILAAITGDMVPAHKDMHVPHYATNGASLGAHISETHAVPFADQVWQNGANLLPMYYAAFADTKPRA
jgi:hypothetical protein